MGTQFTLRESSALYGLLAENSTDIILKTDIEGFIVHASPAIEQLGFLLPNMLIGPHILDLVHPSCAAKVQSEHEAAIRGGQTGQWVEFPAQTQDDREQWYQMQMRRLEDDHGCVYGALAIMRSIEEKRSLEQQLFASAMTDPLTGLTNRQAFIPMLQHLVDKQIDGCLALFGINHFKAINMRYGQSFGDEILIVFADFLRSLMRSEEIISRIGGESFAVLLPRSLPDQAETICRRILANLSDICQAVGTQSFAVTASAGVARIADSLDSTMTRAELALFLAKSKGRNQLEMDNSHHEP